MRRRTRLIGAGRCPRALRHRALRVGVAPSGPREPRVSEDYPKEPELSLHSVCPRASVKQSSPALSPSRGRLLPSRVSRGPRGRHMSSAGAAAITRLTRDQRH